MRSKFLPALMGIAAMFSACSKASDGGPAADGTTHFEVSVDQGIATRAEVTAPTRYIMEVYEGTVTADATPARVEHSEAKFNVKLKDNQEYTVLFWADYGEAKGTGNEYDASDLRTVKVATDKTPLLPAFGGSVHFTVGKDDASSYSAVTLSHAVAQVNFKQTEALIAADNTLVVTYPKSYSINLADNSVAEIAGEVSQTFSYASKDAGTLGTSYIIAGTSPNKAVMDISTVINGEVKKDITNVPFERNFRTNISGAYSNLYATTLTATCEPEWDVPENELIFTPSSISLNQTTATMDIGATLTLTPTVLPATAINKNVIWSSSNEILATVSDAGVVTARLDGDVTITAATVEGGVNATCTIKINKALRFENEGQPGIDGLSWDTAYEIADAEQLTLLSTRVNKDYNSSGAKQWRNRYYKLIADIDFGDSSPAWDPIGRGYDFEGHFDGQNHSLNGSLAFISASFPGLFGQIYGAEIKNIVSNIQWDVTTAGGAIGVIAGSISKNSKIIHCVNNADLICTAYRGIDVFGIGYMNKGGGQIIACVNNGTMSTTSKGAAGIVGYGEANNTTDLIIGCVNTGEIVSSNYAGGIIPQGAAFACWNNNPNVTAFVNNTGLISGAVTSPAAAQSCYWIEASGKLGFGKGSNATPVNCGSFTGSTPDKAQIDDMNATWEAQQPDREYKFADDGSIVSIN